MRNLLRSNTNPPADMLPWVVLIGIGVSWGATGPLSKLAVSGGNHPIGITLWDTLICAVGLTVALIVTGRRIPLTRRHIIFYVVCGFLGTALPSALGYTAYQYLSVGVNMILLSTVPMMTLLIALPLGIEKTDPLRSLGLALGLVAILMIFLPETSLPDPDLAIWVALPIIVSLSYAAENVYIGAKKPSDIDPMVTLCGFCWAGFLLIAPVTFATDAHVDITAFGPPEQAIFANAVLHVGAYCGLVWLIGRAGPVFASQVGYVVTATGVMLGMVIYGERHSAWIWAALALLIIGLRLVKPRESAPSVAQNHDLVGQ